MNNATKVALLAVMLTTLVAGMQVASADDQTNEFKRGAHQQIHEQVEAALEAGDYDAFLEATADGPRAGEITEEQFEVMVEAHELCEAGDREAARELLEQAGIERPGHPGRGGQEGPKNEEARAALEAGDFEAFQEATADGPRAELTEEQFNVLIEAHELRESGDHEAARELLEQAGIQGPQHGKMMRGRGNFQPQN